MFGKRISFILMIFSFRVAFPFNSLGEEAALVNVSISKGGLKCQRVVISDMPNWEEKVIRRYTGCTLQTFVKHYDSTISVDRPLSWMTLLFQMRV